MSVNVVVMGVCGSGKTTVGKAIAAALEATFIDGDDLHPRANILKMAAGHPLNDDDRKPWLQRVSDVFFSLTRRHLPGVVVCSALRKAYRDVIRDGNENLIFIHLHAPFDLICERMSRRQGHYMKTEMVQSQFDALEFPGADERDVINIDVTPPIDEVIAQAIAAVRERAG